MLKYLEDFDCVKFKYGVLPQDEEVLSQIYCDEQNKQIGRLQILPPNYVEKTIEKVYSLSSQKRMSSAKLFNMVRQKIINKFLNIPGLDFLFNEHYFDFEWDMHWGINFEKTSSNCYRDHFEHQIRNMYMMLLLLDEYDFISEIETILLDDTLSKVSEFVSKRFNQYCKEFDNDYPELKLWESCALSFHKEKLNNKTAKISKGCIKIRDFKEMLISISNEYKTGDINRFNVDIEEQINLNGHCTTFYITKTSATVILENLIKKWNIGFEYFKKQTLKYIIRSACIMSALFHDVSYPLCHFRNTQDRISDYLPSMNHFIHNDGIDYDKIVSTIHSSLLCSLINEDELRKSLEANSDYEHGAYSAVTFLLSFYETGRIHDLSPDRRIAVELAALAIYNHNIDQVITKNKFSLHSFSYFRPIYSQNPISFLLKLVDELQEWDRRYFELSEKKEYSFCSNCFYPIINYRTNTLFHYDWNTKYICGCNSLTHYISTAFPHKDMYIVTTCKDMDIYLSGNNLIAKINYNPLKLLKMTEIDIGYAKHRAKSLIKLKKLLLNQNYFISHNKRLPIKDIYIDYIMSANPIYLKAKIMQHFINSQKGVHSDRITLNNFLLNEIYRVIEDFYYVGDYFWKKNISNLISDENIEIVMSKIITGIYNDDISVFIKKYCCKYILTVYSDLKQNIKFAEYIDHILDKHLKKIINNIIVEIITNLDLENEVNAFANDLSIGLLVSLLLKNYKKAFVYYVLQCFKSFSNKETNFNSDLYSQTEAFISKLCENPSDKIWDFILNDDEKQIICDLGYENTNKFFDLILKKLYAQNYIGSILLKESIALINDIMRHVIFALHNNNLDRIFHRISEQFIHHFNYEFSYIFTKSSNNQQTEQLLNENLIKILSLDRMPSIKKIFIDASNEITLNFTQTLLKYYVNNFTENTLSLSSLSMSNFEKYINKINKSLSVYCQLAHTLSLSELELINETQDSFVSRFKHQMVIFSNTAFSDTVETLLVDFYSIMSNSIRLEDGVNSVEREQKYLKLYEPSSLTLSAIEKYCNPLNWYGNGNLYSSFPDCALDYHSDLFLFELLGKNY